MPHGGPTTGTSSAEILQFGKHLFPMHPLSSHCSTQFLMSREKQEHEKNPII